MGNGRRMIDFSKLNEQIAPPDTEAQKAAKKHWNSIAKPIGSLGLLEDAVIRIAGLTGSHSVNLKKRAVLVMCADNGVVAEGVSQTGQDVTAIVAGNMAKGDSSVCRMAALARADVIPVDIGMITDAEGVLNRKIAKGTADLALGPAMTDDQACDAIMTGISLVKSLKHDGYNIIGVGEMGIGNTTTSSAIISVLMDLSVDKATGRGAGLSDQGLKNKISAIQRGIAVNQPNKDDAFDVLCKLGGFDIAGLAGIFIGGAVFRIPIIIDGLITAAAALVAARLCPKCVCAMLASHMSSEPAAKPIFDELKLKPIIHAAMHLGEGTGAVCMLSLVDMALSVYNGMVSFDDIGVEQYKEMP